MLTELKNRSGQSLQESITLIVTVFGASFVCGVMLCVTVVLIILSTP